MRSLTLFAAALALVVGLVAAPAAVEETTLNGKILCAKCTLKKADAKECQDVLVVKGDGDATTEYYIVKNEVAEKFGHTCRGEKAATVTGTVSEKDGRKWIAATTIAEPK
jgi:hypothetical protein